LGRFGGFSKFLFFNMDQCNAAFCGSNLVFMATLARRHESRGSLTPLALSRNRARTSEFN
jgi:hypothetical protein